MLAYTTGRFLAIQRVDGGNRDVIAAVPEALSPLSVIRSPTWAPNGRKIVFSVYETNATIAGSDWREELYAVDLAQRNVTRLTSAVAGDSDHSPVFSPDGGEIAFARWGAQPGIWLVNADGSNLRAIAPVAGYLSGLSWSPDGRTIAFSLRDKPFDADGRSGIYVVGADGSDLHRVAVTYDTFVLDRPTWSPDGQEAEFTANGMSANTRALYAVRPDGTDLHVVLTEPWGVFQPAWQPGGPGS
jgi:TolB protein